MRVVAQRNAIKIHARALMKDRAAADLLNQKYPIQNFNYYKSKYAMQGLSGKTLWARIIQGSRTPNATVNSRFGL